VHRAVKRRETAVKLSGSEGGPAASAAAAASAAVSDAEWRGVTQSSARVDR